MLLRGFPKKRSSQKEAFPKRGLPKKEPSEKSKGSGAAAFIEKNVCHYINSKK